MGSPPKDIRVLAVVPAKAVSIRAPGKNVALLAGKPLYMHAVRVAEEASFIDDVVVSSDSEDVLAHCAAERIRVHRRGPELCTQEARNFDVLRALLAELRAEGIDPEVIVLLQPTTPFRTSGGLDALVGAFTADDSADACVTLRALERARGSFDPDTQRWQSENAGATRIKSDTPLFEATGHVFLLRPARTLDRGTLLGSGVRGEPLHETWIDIDIDTTRELALAQAVAPSFFGSDADGV